MAAALLGACTDADPVRVTAPTASFSASPMVAIAAWTGEEPPSLFGQEFHRNEDQGLYGLHAWAWRHNPAGVFAFAHPKVSCGSAVPTGS